MKHRPGRVVAAVAVAVAAVSTMGTPPAQAAGAGGTTFIATGSTTPALGALPTSHQHNLGGSGTATGLYAGSPVVAGAFTCTASGSSTLENLVIALGGHLTWACAGSGLGAWVWTSSSDFVRVGTHMVITFAAGGQAHCEFVSTGSSFTLACGGARALVP